MSKFFNKLDSWIITLGTAWERKTQVFITPQEAKELANELIDLKNRRRIK